MIYVRALGPPEITIDGAPAPADLLWRKNLALLLYLARAPARRCTRDHAIGLLWPDKEEAAARQSLREAIRVVRRCVGEAQLRTESDQLGLADGAVTLDTDRFDQLVAQEDWSNAAALIAGEFAQGFTVPDSSAFEDWLLAERWHWRSRAMDALLLHAEQRLAAGDLLGADEPARRALQLDPLSDRALRTVMRRLALAGDRTGALELHARFTERATNERTAPPDPETKALAQRLRGAREWKVPQRGVELRRAPLIGRERELAAMVAQWQGAQTGHLALVVLEAPPGAGKTRLAEELMARVALEGGACVAMRAVPGDLEHPWSGALSLARGGLLETTGVAAARPGAIAAIAREAGEWAERFPQSTRTTVALDLESALIEVIRAASVEQPLLLVVDDAQWIDEQSFAFIERLVRDLAHQRILILLGTTPQPAPPKLAELRTRIGRDVRGAALHLGAFDQSAIEALIHWTFPKFTGEQVDRLSRRVAADSAGMPLLAVEICHAVSQGLDLSATSGAWPKPLNTLDQTLPGDLPDTLVAAIRVGFNCLSENARAALRAAAVLGERVPADRIGRAAHLEGAGLEAALDELEWRRWLVAEPRGYAFVARIVREVVDRDMVAAGQRQRILQT